MEEVPDPVPGPHDAVVRMRASSVNFPDVLFVANKYQITIPPPFSPGSEFAGDVVAVGSEVTDVAVGDRVFGATAVGAFADLVCVPAAGLHRLSDGLSYEAAAAFWVAYATSYHSLVGVAGVRSADTVLVLGAAGGVGLAAVQLAKVLGARVIAAASSADKLEVCREHGADELIDYAQDNLRERLKQVAPGGVDVVIDPVGGPFAEQALRGLSQGGRYVVVGFASGEIPKLPANLILLKSAIVRGFEMRTHDQIDHEGRLRGDAELMALFERGAIAPHIGATFPLERAAEALRWVADRRATGKVLIVP